MEKKILIMHLPVLHRGYLDFLEKNQDRISKVYIIGEQLQKELSEFNPDIAAINSESTIKMINTLGISNVAVLSIGNMSEVEGQSLILVQDEISRNLQERYLKENNVEWASVFLRWDKSSVLAERAPGDIPVSQDAFDIEMMKLAYRESEKTGDWWRQIGAVLVKDKVVLVRAYNRDLPSDHTPYQVGEVRDFFKAGERPELANTIHAEQNIVAQAAKNGITLQGSSLYVTHFPCPVCAKMIACSGIKNLYFSEGSAVFDGKKVLESGSIDIIRVIFEKTV